MSLRISKVTVQEFFSLPESSDRTELIDGEIVPKVSPKYKHSISQLRQGSVTTGQSFGKMTQKAKDYLLAGVSHVWVADNQAQSVTAFGANEFPQTFWVGNTVSDELLPGLAIPVGDLFAKRGRSPDADKSK